MNYLNLQLRSSNIFLVLILFIHLGAIFVLSQLTWLWHVKVLAIGVMICSAIYNSYRYALLQNKAAIAALGVTYNGEWWLQTRKDQLFAVSILPSTVVTKLVVILHCKSVEGKKRFYAVLFRDMISKDEFRRLRIWLRFGS